jgi:membrane-associated phospholipid phosphatase
MRLARGTASISCVPALLAALAALAASPTRARADDAAPRRVVVDRTMSKVAVGTMALAWYASEAMKGALAPEACRICGSNAFDDAVRDELRWSSPFGAALTSDVLAYGLVPALGAGALYASRGEDDELLDDLLVVGEAAAAAGVFGQATKFAAGRQRPFLRDLPPDDPATARDRYDDNLSFYSAHTSVTVAIGTSVATLASIRGRRAAPWLWAGNVVAGTAVGYLRIAADKHYATDVLAGAAVGAALGAVVPWLHVANDDPDSRVPAIALTPRAIALTWRL